MVSTAIGFGLCDLIVDVQDRWRAHSSVAYGLSDAHMEQLLSDNGQESAQLSVTNSALHLA